jgi:hypothetical protein
VRFATPRPTPAAVARNEPTASAESLRATLMTVAAVAATTAVVTTPAAWRGSQKKARSHLQARPSLGASVGSGRERLGAQCRSRTRRILPQERQTKRANGVRRPRPRFGGILRHFFQDRLPAACPRSQHLFAHASIGFPGSSSTATSLLNSDFPRPHSTIRLHLSHKRNAIADREQHFVLAISDMHEYVRSGIVIEFEVIARS